MKTTLDTATTQSAAQHTRAAAAPADDLAAAQRVLDLAAGALAAMARGLDGQFSRALDLLAAVRGRVVVTGMGKSGHVARKIAATLASTGTPAQFVHPAEASHGDLGMITQDDAVLALSNSGETAELWDIVSFARRLGIPLLAMTGAPDSELARAASAVLLLAPASEACPHGLAPTTSTTMMLALGDALAVALMERRGISADAFRLYHPRGALGRRLLSVNDVMHRGDELPLVGETARMAEAMIEMTRKSFGCAGVIDADGRLSGIITDGDLRRHMGPELLETPAAAVMTPGPKTVAARSLAAEALGLMKAHRITALFVLDDGRPVGLVHIHDLLRAGLA
jgi:arabinose-5-phosphate isomerase